MLDVFRLLGQFEEREPFAHFLMNVASVAPDLRLAPLYRIDGRTDLAESILPHWKSYLPHWKGYRGEGPVRVGNQAADHAARRVRHQPPHGRQCFAYHARTPG